MQFKLLCEKRVFGFVEKIENLDRLRGGKRYEVCDQ